MQARLSTHASPHVCVDRCAPGPACYCYSQEYGGYPRMISEHLGKCLTEEQRARWVALLVQSAHEAGLPNDAEFRSAFGSYIE